MKVDLNQQVTQAEFGDLVGITQQAVSALLHSGVLKSGASVSTWLQAYCDNLREQAAGRRGRSLDGPDLVDERARLTREHRAMAELRLAEARGELIRVDAVTAAWSRTLTALRDGLMQIPARCSAALAAENEGARVHDLLSAEIHQALEVLSRGAIAPPSDRG